MRFILLPFAHKAPLSLSPRFNAVTMSAKAPETVEVVLWFAREGHEQVAFPYRPWYPQKREVSFADMLRRRGLEHRFSRPLAEGRIDETLLHELISLASNLA